MVIWKNLPTGGPLDTQTYPRLNLKPPSGFSSGKPSAASSARPEAKNPWTFHYLYQTTDIVTSRKYYIFNFLGKGSKKKRQIIHIFWMGLLPAEVNKIHTKEFSKNWPLGRFFHRVAMSVYIYMYIYVYVCLSPFHVTFQSIGPLGRCFL